MYLKKLQVGALGTNCYLLGCKKTKLATVIDPGAEGERILDAASEQDYKIVKIINTHGHWDHVGANGYLREKTGAKVVIHELDNGYFADDRLSGKAFFGSNKDSNELDGSPDGFIKDGDIIEVGAMKIKAIHTPGHSPGCICLSVGELLFTGDTLFKGSIGRTDLAGGDYEKIIKSLKEKLVVLDDALTVLPGHGPQTNLGHEEATNPFFTDLNTL